MTGACGLPLPVQRITDPGLCHATFNLIMKRDDLISGDFPGNKWRKLTLNLEATRRGLTLDRVYVAMMYGIYTHAVRGSFAPGSTVVAVITG